MSNDDAREGFISRWSRRKLGRQSDAEGADATKARPADPAEDPFANFDFDALDFSSDFRRFMADNVPDSVRNLALQKLWSSSDIISQPDELDDYLEDFREEAKALHPDLVRSAYAVGRGMINEEPAETKPAEPTTNDEARSESAGSELATEPELTTEPEKRRS